MKLQMTRERAEGTPYHHIYAVSIPKEVTVAQVERSRTHNTRNGLSYSLQVRKGLIIGDLRRSLCSREWTCTAVWGKDSNLAANELT